MKSMSRAIVKWILCPMYMYMQLRTSTCIYKLCENDLATPTGIIMIYQLTINYTAMFTNLLAKNM